jgi:hypothetical protein
MSSYASLNAGMLARKGEARPSAEPQLAHVLRTPTYRPARQAVLEVQEFDAGDASADDPDPLNVVSAAPPLAEAKVKIDEANAMWPAKKPPRQAVDNDIWRLDQRLGLPPSPRHTERTSVRFTHAQARALKLAALLLDRPQQELLEAGLEGKLEALACTDLANCSCFKTVLATLQDK